jgi:hypothetical protein
VPFAAPKAGITRRLRQVIVLDCQSMPTSHAAVRHGVSWSKARRAELPCERVQRNVIIARAIMSEVVPNFDALRIVSIEIRDVEHWDAGGFESYGDTNFNENGEAFIRLGRSMWSLVHELNHIYLKATTGDSDPTHARWDISDSREGREIRGELHAVALRPVVGGADLIPAVLKLGHDRSHTSPARTAQRAAGA